MTVLERLEAFRALIRQGNALLGEVVVYCREAEAAVGQLAAEKATLDRARSEVQAARAQATADANTAALAMEQVEAQRAELGLMREELSRARSEMTAARASQNGVAEALERSLQDARQRQTELEAELDRVRSQGVSAHAIETRLVQIEQMESRLRAAERELSDARRALQDERGRRDRAIALIKPKAVAAEAAGT